MRLFNLIQQYNGVRFAPYSLGQLTPFLVPNITRGSPYQPAYGVFFLVLAHVNPGHHIIIIKQVTGQGFCQLGFAHPGGSEEDKRADRLLGILKAGPTSPDSIRDGFNGLILPNNPFMKLFFQVQQLIPLTLQHPGNGYSGGFSHVFSYILSIHFFL